MKTKTCSNAKCLKEKPIIEFYKQKTGKFGVRATCKICIKNESKIYYKQNKRLKLIKQKEYRDNNKEKIRKGQKQHYIKNRVKILKEHKKYRDNNKEYFKKYDKQWKKDNKEKLSKKAKNRRKNDIKYKTLCNLRTQINMTLSGNIKSLSTMFLIGCEIDYFMFHIQEQFTKGMTWDNYGIGGWELDHIKPCSLFDLSKKSEQLQCFNYNNIQPLWAEDNRRKGSKY